MWVDCSCGGEGGEGEWMEEVQVWMNSGVGMQFTHVLPAAEMYRVVRYHGLAVPSAQLPWCHSLAPPPHLRLSPT